MSAPVQTRSALADAYDRLAEAYPDATVTELDPGQEHPRGAGWVRAAGLAAGDGDLDSFLDWDDEQVLRDYGARGRPDVVAGFGLHRYAWTACLLITVPWFLHRRVPRLPVEDVSYHRTEGRFSVRTGTFACLPDDPAAVLPGARPAGDEEALRGEVRAALAEHLEPLLGGFGPRMRRRGRALWSVVTDDVVEGLHYIGQVVGEPDRARRELELLLPGSTRPFVGSAGFREVTGPDGAALSVRDRASCCFFYTIRPDDMCDNCPRTCENDRIAKLRATAAS
ncbi:(2Fe-2S)-binding protein [Streptomyces sp. WI04-05B]|uniref:(2Fe-2S)-binding protein n=1 Tax=Streptomyces TaxID=1883 RepID=UPI0029AA2511|nr:MULTISPECIES: (2Fe-2S)-binding protein [unclassified Streptomyces]MDX2543472.1 (2Fe-2S)-binding protein [Streptomyces sp. WI04-05B]MDX2589141.1 (2Fe-2S)-binding protein [Streptomyces sp. WI04-05A]